MYFPVIILIAVTVSHYFLLASRDTKTYSALSNLVSISNPHYLTALFLHSNIRIYIKVTRNKVNISKILSLLYIFSIKDHDL